MSVAILLGRMCVLVTMDMLYMKTAMTVRRGVASMKSLLLMALCPHQTILIYIRHEENVFGILQLLLDTASNLYALNEDYIENLNSYLPD